MQNWKKLGRILKPDQIKWASSHAAVPVADYLRDDIYRIYFSARDEKNRSNTGYFEINIFNPVKILTISPKPVLELGDYGTFDEFGAMASGIVSYNSLKYLYYFGWNRSVPVPFRIAIGLAISKDGGKTFQKYSIGPVLDRGIHDPCFVSNPFVLKEKNKWLMWYLSCIKWKKTSKNQFLHNYHIKYAESDDGINWHRNGTVAIDFKTNREYAISRPCVFKDNGIYKMWFSSRADEINDTYRIRYAESDDGITWNRKDEKIGLDVSASGWDSEMIEYPYVFMHDKTLYMLYNGNNYGESGIGLAVLESD